MPFIPEQTPIVVGIFVPIAPHPREVYQSEPAQTHGRYFVLNALPYPKWYTLLNEHVIIIQFLSLQ
jgi:hypothetical protein